MVFIDHRSPKHLLQQRLTTIDQQYWLVGYQFHVVFKPSPNNKVADALSYQHLVSGFHVITISPCLMHFPKVRDEVQHSPFGS